MFTNDQCKAARAMLNWTIDDLAQRSDVSRSTIILFEKGTDKTKQVTLQRIQTAFNEADIEFLGTQGVNRKTNMVDLLMGENSLETLYDNIVNSISDTKEKVMIINGHSEQKSKFNQNDLINKLIKQKISVKLLSDKKQDSFFLSKRNYRWLPQNLYTVAKTTFIYSNKVAFQLWESKMIVLIHSQEANNAECNHFNKLWKLSTPPK